MAAVPRVAGAGGAGGIALAESALVIPTLHQVVGAPVPGTSGVRPRPTPQPFRDLLRQLRNRPTTTGVATPGASVPVVRQPSPVRPLGTTAAPTSVRPSTPRPATSTAVPRHTSSAGTAGSVHPLRGAARDALVRTIHATSEDAGVEPTLSVAIARAESSLDPTAVSPDGQSVGTFQMTHATKAEMHRKIARGDVERPDGPDEVALPVGYLHYLDDVFASDTTLGRGLTTVGVDDPAQRERFTVAAYNAGEGRVAAAQARAEQAGLDPTRFEQVRPFLPSITQAYVARVGRYQQQELQAARSAGTSVAA